MMLLNTEVNGKKIEMNVDPEMRLIDFLREELSLTGTKEGCSEGECGACTVLLDGIAVNSCMILAHQVRGKSVLTIESLGEDEELEQLQTSFVEKGAVQCGFCTPGMLMSSKALLMKTKEPTEDEIKKALEGNLCRCTGYNKILDAVQDAAEKVGE